MSLISGRNDKSEIIYNSWWHISRHYTKYWQKTYLWHCFAMRTPYRTISFLILNQTLALITHISSELRKKSQSNSATISHDRKTSGPQPAMCKSKWKFKLRSRRNASPYGYFRKFTTSDHQAIHCLKHVNITVRTLFSILGEFKFASSTAAFLSLPNLAYT